jgi:hypothetical protein
MRLVGYGKFKNQNTRIYFILDPKGLIEHMLQLTLKTMLLHNFHQQDMKPYFFPPKTMPT